jgi:hypothetical protein
MGTEPSRPGNLVQISEGAVQLGIIPMQPIGPLYGWIREPMVVFSL